MYQLIFRNWKFAALWAIGISASVAAFFEPGGGQEQLAASAEKIETARAIESSVVSLPAPAPDDVAVDEPLSEEDAAAAEAGAPVTDNTVPAENDPTEEP
ncbi:hypothetical protein [Novosphingobium sp.]|uniref:hypothetical protein n=1 Tax=Novosphingobium sp. TaxID=1874826 RepID=UPI002732CE13|nr:hypothetical protein [Novosphingobium sp.]MDP3907844.1 hypothetical protein [Novosphingobium sp.]